MSFVCSRNPEPHRIVCIDLGGIKHLCAVFDERVEAVRLSGVWHVAETAFAPDFIHALDEAYAAMPSNV